MLPEDERALWLARHEAERERCRDCNLPRSVCGDHERTLYPFRVVCYASMERQAAVAAYEALHKDQPYHDGTFETWAKDRSEQFPYHYSDGVTFGVAETDLTPHDKFATKVDASPVPEQGEET